jgi:hypothetical protein
MTTDNDDGYSDDGLLEEVDRIPRVVMYVALPFVFIGFLIMIIYQVIVDWISDLINPPPSV